MEEARVRKCRNGRMGEKNIIRAWEIRIGGMET
jgi:hypothetical protein